MGNEGVLNAIHEISAMGHINDVAEELKFEKIKLF